LGKNVGKRIRALAQPPYVISTDFAVKITRLYNRLVPLKEQNKQVFVKKSLVRIDLSTNVFPNPRMLLLKTPPLANPALSKEKTRPLLQFNKYYLLLSNK